MDSDEVQLVEALRRDSHMNGHSRPEDGGMAAIAPANHSEYVTTSANVKVDPKKRKRVRLISKTSHEPQADLGLRQRY